MSRFIENGLTGLVAINFGGGVAALIFGRTDAAPLFLFGLISAGAALFAFRRLFAPRSGQ